MASADVYVSFGADTGGLEAALAVTQANVKATAAELRALAAEMNATGAAADSALGQKVLAAGASLAAAKAHVSDLKTEMKGLGEGSLLGGFAGSLQTALAPLAAIKESLGGVVELFAAAFAVDKVVEYAKAMGDLGEETDRTSKILGLTSEQVGELQYQFAATGTDAGNLDRMVGTFEENLAKAAAGTGPATAGLRALGLNAKELVGLPFPAQLDKMADAVSRLADGTNKTAALQSLGRGFVEMIPLLDEGAAGFDLMREKADETNSVLDATATGSLVEMQNGFTDLGAAIKGDALQGFLPFVNAVNGAVRGMTDLAEAFSNSVKNGGDMAQVLGLLASALQNTEQFIGETVFILEQLGVTGAAALNVLKVEFYGFGDFVGDIFKALGAGIPAFFTALVAAGGEAVRAVEQQFLDLGTVIGDTLKLNFAGAKTAFGDMGSDAAASAAKISGAFSGVFDFSKAAETAKATADQAASIWAAGDAQIVANARTAAGEYASIWGSAYKGGGAEGPEQGGKAQVAAMVENAAAGARQAAEAVNQTFAESVQKAQDAAKGIEASLNEELKTHKLTMSQWLADTDQALNAEALAVTSAANKATASTALSAEQKKEIWAKEAHDLQTIADQEVAAQTKAAEASAQAWKSFADKGASLVDGQVDGVLRGTTTIGQAFKNMTASGLEDIIKFYIKWAAEHAATITQNILGLGMQTAAVDGNVVAQTGAIGTGVAAQKAINASSISSDAGRAAAGAYAAVAGVPIIGPVLAPAAAAVAFGAVEAFSAFDIGAWSVPSDMPAIVHRNELVMPAAEAGAFRNMLSSGARGGGDAGGGMNIGGPSFAFHSLDPSGVAAAFERNKGALMKSIQSATRDGAHLAMRRGSRFG